MGRQEYTCLYPFSVLIFGNYFDSKGSNSMKKIKLKRQQIFTFLFILFAVRILYLILVPPFIGIANNGDFQRLMIPTGLDYAINIWDTPEHYQEYFWNWVTNNFAYIEPSDNGWHNIFIIFPKIAITLGKIFTNGKFDIRFMGLVNASCYLLAGYLLFRLVEKIPGLKSYLVLALLVLVLGDSYVLQYFNSFYTEIGSVTFVLLLWILLAGSFLYGKDEDTKKKVRLVVLDSIVALFAIMSKQQDILLLLPVLAIFALLFQRFRLKKSHYAVWALLFLTLIVSIFRYNEAGGNITSFNVISMDMLVLSRMPQEQLRDLGLDQGDIDTVMSGVGNSAFTAPYNWGEFAYIFDRKAELKILAKEPAIFFRMVDKRAGQLFMDAPLGNYMQSSGAIEREKTTKNRLWYQIKEKIYIRSIWFYMGVIILAVMLALVTPRMKAMKGVPRDLFWVYGMLPVANLLRFLTIILGDGSFDDIKHFFTVNFEFDMMFIGNIIILILILIAQKEKA